MEELFNIVVAYNEDGTRQVATAIPAAQAQTITTERLVQILEVQRVTLLEKGDKASKEEANKIAQILVSHQDAEVVFEISQENFTREEYVEFYEFFGEEDLSEDVIKDLDLRSI